MSSYLAALVQARLSPKLSRARSRHRPGLRGLALLLAFPLFGFQWTTPRGPADGSQHAEGVGAIDDMPGGYPVLRWSLPYGSSGFTKDQAMVADVDDDGQPEVIGLSQNRVILWETDGSVRAVSESIAEPTLVGIYNLDEDPDTKELVVSGKQVGGGEVILDAKLLTRRWRSPDPLETLEGLGVNFDKTEVDNVGVSYSETLVVDIDGDGRLDVLRGVSVIDDAWYFVYSFNNFLTNVREVAVPLPRVELANPILSGQFLKSGFGPHSSFIVDQSTTFAVMHVTEPSGSADADEYCSADQSLCMRVDGQYTGVHDSWVIGDFVAFDAGQDGDDETLPRIP